MSHQDPPEEKFSPAPPTLETSDYVVFRGNDSLVVLSEQAQGVMLGGTFATKYKNVFIYADTVKLSSEIIRVAGLHLRILCRRLKLTEDKVCIDVSGNNGEAGTTEAKRDKGKPGGAGGSICLCVQEPDPGISSRLTLNCSGGDGGRGVSRENGTDKGGDGGDGGECGKILCFVNFTPIGYGKSMYRTNSNTALKWPDRVTEFAKTIESQCALLKAWRFDEKAADGWESSITQHLALVTQMFARHMGVEAELEDWGLIWRLHTVNEVKINR
ncbi:0ed8eb2a-4471-47ae-8bca-ff7022c632a6 [Sclerotinia trifoliorum]|uniref:0ed8eb2a-4471-47ae-8bca-ff7022c632a6 n=1 Tax=Sclerotinia trifoliorum TaxID=28548 RepID=A0A8H2W0U7_9HELO|nr:0ed8eb2a-4471-47ae-8bca-ff7022c632a6 [Sclerotinia trifoliorum]